tara:strand:- start:16032 stop:17018 length:987 start_codon:yes stop_codon:yes gene_type:complete
MKNILVTGGAGYIGSHICLRLLEHGYCPIVLDNLTNGHRDSVPIEASFVRGDIRDRATLDHIFIDYKPIAVIHLAGLIEAGLSMRTPEDFYNVNVTGSQVLFASMRANECYSIVFSSTAAVYGNCSQQLIDEEQQIRPTNPYGRSKAIVETILQDYSEIYGFKALALRYFNAAGADPNARAGERHTPETHLIPLAFQAAAGITSGMQVFGTDYNTLDGTCIRDYIHVDDLAKAHIDALNFVTNQHQPNFDYINIGTESGASVLQVLELCQQITGKSFEINYQKRRDGDPERLVASAQKAKRLLNWTARFRNLEEIISHAWSFFESQSK